MWGVLRPSPEATEAVVNVLEALGVFYTTNSSPYKRDIAEAVIKRLLLEDR